MHLAAPDTQVHIARQTAGRGRSVVLAGRAGGNVLVRIAWIHLHGVDGNQIVEQSMDSKLIQHGRVLTKRAGNLACIMRQTLKAFQAE